jgi:hypothetical protein
LWLIGEISQKIMSAYIWQLISSVHAPTTNHDKSYSSIASGGSGPRVINYCQEEQEEEEVVVLKDVIEEIQKEDDRIEQGGAEEEETTNNEYGNDDRPRTKEFLVPPPKETKSFH